MESSIIHIVLEQCRNIDLVYTVYVTPDFREKPVRGILASHQTQNPPVPISIGNERAELWGKSKLYCKENTNRYSKASRGMYCG